MLGDIISKKFIRGNVQNVQIYTSLDTKVKSAIPCLLILNYTEYWLILNYTEYLLILNYTEYFLILNYTEYLFALNYTEYWQLQIKKLYIPIK